jgi:hypothetical protein
MKIAKRVKGTSICAWKAAITGLAALALLGSGGCTFDSPIETRYLESQGPDTTTTLPEIPILALNTPDQGSLDCPAGHCQDTYRVQVDGFGILRIRVKSTFSTDDVTMKLTILNPVGNVIGRQRVESGKPASLTGEVTTGSYFLLLQSLGGGLEYEVAATYDRRGSAKAPLPPPEAYIPAEGNAPDYSQPGRSVPAGLGAGFIRDPKADFTQYKKFAFAQNPAKTMAEGAPGQYVGSPFLDAEIQRAIRYELMDWGYLPVDEKDADVLISSHVGSQSRSYYVIDYVTYDVPYEALMSRWTYSAGAIITPAIYKRGTLVIDVVDRHSTNVVWHGWSNRSISGRGDTREVVRDVVREVLDQYRPKE